MAFNTVPLNGWPQLKNLGEGGGDVSALTARVEALETTVGDSDSGLVKDVDALETVVGDSDSGLVKDVDALETTVGDSEGGLVKDVTDLQNANKYLTTETLVGKWGSSNLYRKYVTTGALPNHTLKSFDVGITTETVRRIEMYYDSNAEFGPFPNNEGTLSFNKSTKKLDVATVSDYSGYTGVVIVEYTK